MAIENSPGLSANRAQSPSVQHRTSRSSQPGGPAAVAHRQLASGDAWQCSLGYTSFAPKSEIASIKVAELTIVWYSDQLEDRGRFHVTRSRKGLNPNHKRR